MAEAPLPPGSTIGILGGGQLGRMLAMAAARLGLKCHIFADAADSPAFDVTAAETLAEFSDLEALRTFAGAVDAATIEFENVPKDAFAEVARHVPAYPPPRTLEVAQDRVGEKTFVEGLSIPVAPYRRVDSAEDMEAALAEIGAPALLKTRSLGYDGKGQARIHADTDLRAAFAEVGGVPAILEAVIPFECEVSVVVVRSASGEVRTYAPSENLHRNQILSESKVPANVPAPVAEMARSHACRIAEELDYVGVLCVEMFYCGAEAEAPLLVNEMAPRVHNSGHWTIDACLVSQFENHMRAVAGWPLGPTERHSDALMVNLIGDDVERWHAHADDGALALHLYGKNEARPGRKMGHLTRLYPRADKLTAS